jgi:hypothetical protein
MFAGFAVDPLALRGRRPASRSPNLLRPALAAELHPGRRSKRFDATDISITMISV